MDLEELLSRVNPKTAALFRRASEIENRLLPTPSLGINLATGGIGYGRQTMLWGNRSGGKTAFCLQLAAQAQKDGELVAWTDAEKNFDPAWAARLGVDTDKLVVSNVTSIADFADSTYEVIKAGAGVVIVDSISVLMPQSFFVEGEMKALADTGQIGTYAKNMGAALNMINNINRQTAVVLISQMRNKINTWGASASNMGGLGADHMNSTLIKLWSNPAEKEAIMGKEHHGDIVIEKPIGRPVRWTIDKSRGPGMNMTGTYDFYFAGSEVGVDLTGEIVDFGVQYGVINKAGAWYTVGDERLQGRSNVVKYLKANPETADEFYNRIMGKVNEHV